MFFEAEKIRDAWRLKRRGAFLPREPNCDQVRSCQANHFAVRQRDCSEAQRLETAPSSRQSQATHEAFSQFDWGQKFVEKSQEKKKKKERK